MELKKNELEGLLQAARIKRHKLEDKTRRSHSPQVFKDLDKKDIARLKDYEKELEAEISKLDELIKARGEPQPQRKKLFGY